MLDRAAPPEFDVDDALRIAAELFGVAGVASELPSYADRNFRIDADDGSQWVLKIANAAEDPAVLDLQNAAMRHVDDRWPGWTQTLRRSIAGRDIERVSDTRGVEHAVRVTSYLRGRRLCDLEDPRVTTWRSLGQGLAHLTEALSDLDHPGGRREFRWDLAQSPEIVGASAEFADHVRRRLVERVQLQYLADVHRRLACLPRSIVHNDANDHNLLVSDAGDVVGFIDFGDMVETARVFDLAIACAYAILDRPDPLAVAAEIVSSYDAVTRLSDLELEVLFPAIAMRLVVSVTASMREARLDPDNEYLRTSEAPAWRMLEHLDVITPAASLDRFRRACGREPVGPVESPPDLAARRGDHLSNALSLAYRRPIEVTRGRMQYLFDEGGRAYLDLVNNVCHVGHCHPHVVEAATRQMRTLNTNTRYLHELIVRYAERLTGLFPHPLSVCFLVNSGSEANELAIRLARAATGRRDFVVVEAGYHGHTNELIDISHYKHAGPGGRGAPDWVHVAPLPDVYRGGYRADDPQAAERYAAHVGSLIDEASSRGRSVAAFMCEPIIGCGGQIVPPDGYLRDTYAHARAAGAICIADEVQIGFGRIGTHMWGFQTHGVVPDIVTLGKPIGNGHPIGAVVTTPAIARAFETGMEFFSTFGGNPVSCAVGLAVLDVIERDDLREHALRLGSRLRAGLRRLQDRHESIGDVRGSGLFLGVELVRDRVKHSPAGDLVAAVNETARDSGILLSSDGPDHNVIKIKPPMAVTDIDIDLTLAVVDRVLAGES